jgi:hypothetical protein
MSTTFPKQQRREEKSCGSFHPQGFKKVFTGPAIAPTARRFMQDLLRRCNGLEISTKWTEIPDLIKFFRTLHGSPTAGSFWAVTIKDQSRIHGGCVDV